MNFFGTGVRFSRRAISCRSLSGSRFANSEKTAHSSVEYQKSLSNALITALETVGLLLCHVSCNLLDYATTAAAGHCKGASSPKDELSHFYTYNMAFLRHRDSSLSSTSSIIKFPFIWRRNIPSDKKAEGIYKY